MTDFLKNSPLQFSCLVLFVLILVYFDNHLNGQDPASDFSILFSSCHGGLTCISSYLVWQITPLFVANRFTRLDSTKECYVRTRSLSHGLLFCGLMMICSPPGSSVHGVLQARILKWVAISSSRASFQPRDQTHFSCTLAGRFFTAEPLGKPQIILRCM